MQKTTRENVAIIAIISIAAFAGNMLNIGLSYAVYWQSLDPTSFMKDFAVKFPLLLAPTAITLLPALIATTLSFILHRDRLVARRSWMIALLGLLLTVGITLIYHLPTNLAFIELRYPPAEATYRLQVWIFLHWVRTIVTLLAAVFAIFGFRELIKSVN
ncbi:MAG: DUF1772 domain-containing protein [Cyanophyceae cyanobacterium]